MRPYTLTHTTRKNSHCTTPQHTPPQTRACAARCSQPLSTNQTPHPTTKDGATTTQPHHKRRGHNGPVASKPNSVPVVPADPETPFRVSDVCCAPHHHPLQAMATLPTASLPRTRGRGKPVHGAP